MEKLAGYWLVRSMCLRSASVDRFLLLPSCTRVGEANTSVRDVAVTCEQTRGANDWAYGPPGINGEKERREAGGELLVSIIRHASNEWFVFEWKLRRDIRYLHRCPCKWYRMDICRRWGTYPRIFFANFPRENLPLQLIACFSSEIAMMRTLLIARFVNISLGDLCIPSGGL